MYAVIKNGGKQYRVSNNQVVKLEKLSGEVGEKIKFDDIIALSDGNEINVDKASLDNLTVSAEILEQKKDKKIIIFKKKRRQNYRRKNGHRQQVTVVRILDVSGKGSVAAIEKKVEAKASKTETKSED